MPLPVGSRVLQTACPVWHRRCHSQFSSALLAAGPRPATWSFPKAGGRGGHTSALRQLRSPCPVVPISTAVCCSNLSGGRTGNEVWRERKWTSLLSLGSQNGVLDFGLSTATSFQWDKQRAPLPFRRTAWGLRCLRSAAELNAAKDFAANDNQRSDVSFGIPSFELTDVSASARSPSPSSTVPEEPKDAFQFSAGSPPIALAGQTKNLTILRSLFPYLWPSRRSDRVRVIASAASLVVAKIATVHAPLMLSKIIDSISSDTRGAAPAAMIIGYGFARISASAFGELRNGLFARISHAGCREIACSSFSHLHSLDLDFLLTSKAGELSTILSRGTKAVTQLLSMMLFQVFPTLFEFGLVVAVLSSRVDTRVAAITALTMISYGYFTAKVTSQRTEFRKAMNRAEQRANGLLLDSLANAEAVRHNTSEVFELERFKAHRKDFELASVKVQQSLSWLNFGQQFIFNCGLLGCLALTAQRAASGDVPVGHMVLVSSLLFQLAIPLNFFGTVYRETTLNLIDMKKLYELLNMKSKCSSAADAPRFKLKTGHIRLENMSFGYHVESKAKATSGATIGSRDGATHSGQTYVQVFKDLTLDIPGGTTVAVVGPSGGGKSTLVKLICRLYDPTGGHVEIDGQDLRDVNSQSFREHIGVVPQDVVLFNDKLLHNLRYGSPNSTFEEAANAAKLSQLHETIQSLPLGYDTPVGERGLKLSGGEKQRVGIARCLLRRPAIFLLDEATSSLDIGTERRIMRAIRDVLSSSTCIIIAHRLSTVMDADVIYYVDHGQILESGSFKELLAIPNGNFAKLWQKQMKSTTNTDTSLAKVIP